MRTHSVPDGPESGRTWMGQVMSEICPKLSRLTQKYLRLIAPYSELFTIIGNFCPKPYLILRKKLFFLFTGMPATNAQKAAAAVLMLEENTQILPANTMTTPHGTPMTRRLTQDSLKHDKIKKCMYIRYLF